MIADRGLSVVARLTLVGLASALALLMGEATVRAVAAIDPQLGRLVREYDPMAVLIEPHGTFGYRQRPGSIYHYGNGSRATANEQGFRGPTVAVPKPDGVVRVVVLGGSTSHGWGVNDDSTIDAHMRRILTERYPSRRFEVVNLGFDGYDSYQDLERLRSDGLRLAPDVVIVHSGINDVRNARFADLRDPDPRTLIWEPVLRRLRDEHARGGPTTWTRVKHRLMLARLGSIVRDRTRARRPPAVVHGDRGARTAAIASFTAADQFERRVEEISRLVLAQGGAVMLSTPPSSLRISYRPVDMSGRDYWIGTAEQTQAYRDTLDTRMRAVGERLRGRGGRVVYVSHALAGAQFLDDAHPTADGNRQIASDFAAALPLLLPNLE